MTSAEIITFVPKRPAIDLEAARRFLADLDPQAVTFHFTLLPDGAVHRGIGGLFYTGPASWPVISTLCGNRNAAGAAVCVAVNAMKGSARKSANVIRIRAVFADWDHGIPASIPLEPSILNQTSAPNGHIRAQALWLINTADTMDRQTFAGIEARLVADHGADEQAVDVARVLRLPGFLHQKDPRHPFLVRRIGGSDIRYKVAEIFAAFPPIVKSTSVSMPAGLTLDAGGADRQRRYAVAAIQRTADHLANLRDGRRGTVFTAACSLGKFVAHGVIGRHELEQTLLAAWQASGGLEAYGRGYALGAIRRGLERSANDPLPDLDAAPRPQDREVRHADR